MKAMVIFETVDEYRNGGVTELREPSRFVLKRISLCRIVSRVAGDPPNKHFLFGA